MSKMSLSSLKALIGAEKADALSAVQSSKLSRDRTQALSYYLGDMTEDMPVPDGRSAAVSTDVSDTIEALMPALMDIFTSGEEVIRFEPVGPEDVQAAEQETDYLNHVFLQQNAGFMVLYSFIKDALLSKVGIVKVDWEKKEKEEKETYLDLDDQTFSMIVADTSIEVVEHSIKESPYAGGESADPRMVAPPPTHDVTIVHKRDYECAKVHGVPPEEFGISKHARSIHDADYAFHETLKTQGELIAQGFDKSVVEKLPSFTDSDNPETFSRDTVEEGAGDSGDEVNKSARQIKVTEHYIRMDYTGDKACLYRVTTGGDDNVILTRDGEPDVIEEAVIPFAVMTPVPVTHRFFGRSVADLVMDIQRIKTALTRGALDNLYLHNNPRVEVSDAYASENTLDDLLVSRPGGIVRTKMPGGLNWQTVPDITASIYPALQYFDATREWRTGVSRQGQGVDPNALQNQVATIANQMFDASQAKVKLIARIFAETGIKDMFMLLHGVIRRNGSKAQTVRLRNQWVLVDPRNWKTREDMTINVGLGTGGKQQQLAQIQLMIGAQEKGMAAGLVSKMNLYNSAKELTRLVGHKDVDQFFVAPKPPQPMPGQQPQGEDPNAPIQPPPDPEVQKLQMEGQLKQQEMQSKAEIEKTQAMADIETQKQKTAHEMALAERKFELEREIKLIEAQLKQTEHQQKMEQSRINHRHSMEQAAADQGMPAAPEEDAPIELVREAGKLVAVKRGDRTIPVNRRD